MNKLLTQFRIASMILFESDSMVFMFTNLEKELDIVTLSAKVFVLKLIYTQTLNIKNLFQMAPKKIYSNSESLFLISEASSKPILTNFDQICRHFYSSMSPNQIHELKKQVVKVP